MGAGCWRGEGSRELASRTHVDADRHPRSLEPTALTCRVCSCLVCRQTAPCRWNHIAPAILLILCVRGIGGAPGVTEKQHDALRDGADVPHPTRNDLKLPVLNPHHTDADGSLHNIWLAHYGRESSGKSARHGPYESKQYKALEVLEFKRFEKDKNTYLPSLTQLRALPMLDTVVWLFDANKARERWRKHGWPRGHPAVPTCTNRHHWCEVPSSLIEVALEHGLAFLPSAAGDLHRYLFTQTELRIGLHRVHVKAFRMGIPQQIAALPVPVLCVRCK